MQRNPDLRLTRRGFLIATTASAALANESADKSVRLVNVPNGGIQPQLVISDGILHLVYFSGDPKHGGLYYVQSKDFGQTFTSPLRVNNQDSSAIAIGAIRGAQLAVAKDRVHVAWNGSDAAQPRGPVNPESHQQGSPMLYSRLNDQGTAFEPQRNLMTKTFGLDGGGSIAADHSGNVYVAWHGKIEGAAKGEAGRQVWISHSTDGGRMFSPEYAVSGQTGACGCCGMRIFADSRGMVYALYRSATDNVHRDIYLLKSEDHGRNFSSAKLHPWELNACPMSSMAFLEAGKDVIGAWETQTQVYFAPVNHGIDTAKNATIAPPGVNPKRKYPTLGRNRRGETLIAWAEGAGWQRSGRLGWQIFDNTGKPTVACGVSRDIPVWSFPAAFANPDQTFTILV